MGRYRCRSRSGRICSAAVEAAGNGASVLLLESQPEIGGNTLISGGFYASVDKKRQEKQGITDSVELHVQQTYDLGGRLGDPKLVRTMVTEAQESLEWLEKLGMHFQPRVFELYGAHWPRAIFLFCPSVKDTSVLSPMLALSEV